MTDWLDKPEQWSRLAAALVAKGEAGIDSETYGQPNRTSPQHRTKVHCWSIAVLGNVLHPRGYHKAKGVALPREALEYAELRRALTTIKLWAHNAPHDQHSLANEGLVLDIQDTLQWARVAVPGRRDYGLKSHGVKLGMEQWALGKPMREDFLTLIKYDVVETQLKTRKSKRCACGKLSCRARQTSTYWDEETGWFKEHVRSEVVEEYAVEKTVHRRWEVNQFNLGHERWERWLAYVVADAVSGIEIVDWLRNLRVVDRPYPWRTRGK